MGLSYLIEELMRREIPAFVKAVELIAKTYAESKTAPVYTNVTSFIEKLADRLAMIEGQLEVLVQRQTKETRVTTRQECAEALEAAAHCWPNYCETRQALMDQAMNLRRLNVMEGE